MVLNSTLYHCNSGDIASRSSQPEAIILFCAIDAIAAISRYCATIPE
jgi:hypothetical protein